jgi:branched-chain amino acid transport system ATP-binding protein
MTSPILSLKNVSKRFGGVAATNNVSLDLEQGELHAVIGPNGAGKSTLFALIAGQFRPDQGQVWLDGRDITLVPGHRRIQLGISRAFQVARIFTNLTVHQNIQVAVNAHAGRSRHFLAKPATTEVKRQVAETLDSVSLHEQHATLAGILSQGDRKRLEIAMALTLEPRLLLLDEPTAGMSPEETESTVNLVRRIWQESGTTILLTEHDMGVVFGLAQRVTVLNLGSILCTGGAPEIRSRADVKEIYLGHGVATGKSNLND